MTIASRHRDKLAARALCAAAGIALVWLPGAASAFTLNNDIVAKLTYSLYDQTDFIMGVPCYQENLDNKGERTFSGFPPSCAGRIQLKVKVEIGSVTCMGENLTPNGTARITGSTTSCSVTVGP